MGRRRGRTAVRRAARVVRLTRAVRVRADRSARPRHGECEGGARPVVRLGPEGVVVALDDRATDGEPDAHAALLGRMEGVDSRSRLWSSRPVPASRTVTRTAAPPSHSVLTTSCLGRSSTSAGGRGSASSSSSTTRFRCRSLSDSGTTSRVASFRSIASSVNSRLLNMVRSRVMTSDARCPTRRSRRAASRARGRR